MSRRRNALLVVALLASCHRGDDPTDVSLRAIDAARKGRRAEALSAAARAQNRLPPRGEAWWRLRLLQAEVLVESDRAAEARQTLPTGQRPGSPGLMLARWETVQGEIEAALGREQEADAHLQRAIALIAPQSTDELLSETEWRRAVLLASSGRQTEAEALAQRVLRRADGLGQHRWRGAARMTLGALASKRQEWGPCTALLARAETDLHEVGAEALEAEAQTTRGVCTYRTGQYERSRDHLTAAIATQERLRLDSALATSVGALGDSYLMEADATRALPYLVRGLALAQRYRPSVSPQRAGNLAEAYRMLGDEGHAHELDDLAKRLAAERHDATALRVLRANSAILAKTRGDLPLAERLFRELLAEAQDDEIAITVRARLAAVCSTAGRHDEAGALYARARSDLDRRAAQLSDTERIALGRRFVDIYYDNVEWLVSQHRAGEALALVEAWRATTLTQQLGLGSRPVSLETRAARRHQIFISYWLAPLRSYAWVIAGARVDMVTLADQAVIDQAVREYRDTIANSLRDPRTTSESPGRTLYDLLIAPLARFVPPGANVVVAADGTLHSLPFGALIAPSPAPHYWLEDVTLTVAPALTALPGADPPWPATPRAIVLGDARDGGDEFPPLGFAAAEVATLKSSFATLITVTGPAARADAYAQIAARPASLMHVIAHAVADKNSPLDSYLVFAGPDPERRLSVRAIMKVPLDTDLVTLSACRSAESTAYAGEGLVGLAWGFLGAGARYVIASMWDVPDRSTAALMELFYAAIKSGASPPAALHTAQLALSRRPGTIGTPYHWAAFNAYAGPGPRMHPAMATRAP